MNAVSVMDCSAVTAVLLNEPEGEQIEAQLTAGASGECAIRVPALFWSEVVNVLLSAERRRRITRAEAVNLRGEVDVLPVATDTQFDPLTRRRIHELALAHKLTAYDATYLELAERFGARLKTLDPDLLALRGDYPWIE